MTTNSLHIDNNTVKDNTVIDDTCKDNTGKIQGKIISNKYYTLV